MDNFFICTSFILMFIVMFIMERHNIKLEKDIMKLISLQDGINFSHLNWAKTVEKRLNKLEE